MYYTATLCNKLVLLVLVRLKIVIARLITIKIFNRSAALVFILQHFWDTASSLEYMTACDIKEQTFTAVVSSGTVQYIIHVFILSFQKYSQTQLESW